MATKPKTVDAPREDTAPAQDVALTIDEFCRRLSETDKRVPLIGGFHAEELAAGRTKDRESAYRDRYAAFINRPA